MLGEKRNTNELLSTAPQKKERKNMEREKVIAHSIVANPQLHEKKVLTYEPVGHTVLFGEDNVLEYQDVLVKVQGHITESHSEVLAEKSIDLKEHLLRYIRTFLRDEKIKVEGKEPEELVQALYTDMAEYSFLTKYIFGSGIEEIDINSWKDIEVQYSDGRTEKIKEHFESPEHAINVIRRMLHVSGMVLDNARPIVLGHLSKNIRIAAMKTPIVDEDVGISASIRIVNPQVMQKEDFIIGSTATEEMLEFLSMCIRFGVSICIAGATSSGKTTLLGWLLSTIPNGKRIYTIENGSRELDLVREMSDGRVENSVIHTLTRDSDNHREKIDQIALLDVALRFNPDVAVIGEMRGPEANAGQEMARTGVTVVTTIHANSCEATYRRMVSLCKRAVDMTDSTLMQYVTEAYPIIVFCKQLENKERRLMEIMECEILPDGERQYHTLYQFVITENHIENDTFIVEGHHEKRKGISESLSKRLLENGMSIKDIKRWVGKEKL